MLPLSYFSVHIAVQRSGLSGDAIEVLYIIIFIIIIIIIIIIITIIIMAGSIYFCAYHYYINKRI